MIRFTCKRVEDKKRVHLEYFSTPDLPQEVRRLSIDAFVINKQINSRLRRW
jgi:hypothetical protein